MKELDLKSVYANTVTDLAKNNDDVYIVEADLSNSIGTLGKKEELKERYVNVGIAEAELVGVGAGLSVIGNYPFMHTFAPFMTRRVYDQVFLSFAYAKNKGVLFGSDPGICAEKNGGTHMCFEDVSLMRTIPGMYVYDVSQPTQLEMIIKKCYKERRLAYIRSGRKKFHDLEEFTEESVEKGYSVLKEQNANVTIFVSGILTHEVLKAAKILNNQGKKVNVVEMYRIKPINKEIIIEAAKRGLIVTVENHNVIGGLGSAVAEVVAEECPTKVYRLGVREKFGQVGDIDYLKEQYGISADQIASFVGELK